MAQYNGRGHSGFVTIESVGGYRLVRKLGAGERAEVYLGHARSAPSADTDAHSAAIKLYRPEATRDSIDREIEALSRGSVAHRVVLLDLATAVDGKPALILERLSLGSLGKLLVDRDVLRAGECVTILAPLALAMAQLHEAGVVHGGIRLEAIGFRESGAPVLANFGRAQLLVKNPSIATLQSDPLVAADCHALLAVARATIERARVALGCAELIEWFDFLARQSLLDSFPTALAERLFDFAEAEPVRFDLGAPPPHDGVPARAVSTRVVDYVQAPEPQRCSSLLAAFSLPDWLAEHLVSSVDSHPVSDLRARLTENLKRVRKPYWIVVGASAAALVVAIAAVPSGSTNTAQATAPSATPTRVPLDLGDVGGDDPLAALDELLATRDRCIADASVLCLDAVDQRGSAALRDDQTRIRSLQGGAESAPIIRSSQPSLVERLGDTALLSLGDVAESQPASVLMMKGESGWRIREWLDG